jgi:gliding motility-associated-like protein
MSAAFTVIKSGPASLIDAGYIVTNAFSDSQVITVTVEGWGEYKFQLDNGPLQDDNVFTNVSPGDHTITVYDTKGINACETVILSSVSVIDYPNFFTPNGDGYHDTWNIIGLGSQEDAKIYIFDRYGKLIKQISSAGDGWDGTYNGNQLPADDYWFTVTYREMNAAGESVVKEFKSHFAMKR